MKSPFLETAGGSLLTATVELAANQLRTFSTCEDVAKSTDGRWQPADGYCVNDSKPTTKEKHFIYITNAISTDGWWQLADSYCVNYRKPASHLIQLHARLQVHRQ